MSKIITTKDLSDYLKKTLVPGHAQPVVNGVNAWIETRTKRCWGELKQTTERCTYKNPVWLRHQDVVSVDEIKLGYPGQQQTTLQATAYYCDELGRVTQFGGVSRPIDGFMTVKYSYGVEEIPDDLIHAALGIAAGYYNWAINGQKDIVSAGVGSYRLQYSSGGGSGSTGGSGTADALFKVVDSYSTRRV